MQVLDIVAISASFALVLFVIEAIRRSHLNARYAITWLGAGGVLLIFSLYRPLLDLVARLLGVSYPPSLLFGLAWNQFGAATAFLGSACVSVAAILLLTTVKAEKEFKTGQTG